MKTKTYNGLDVNIEDCKVIIKSFYFTLEYYINSDGSLTYKTRSLLNLPKHWDYDYMEDLPKTINNEAHLKVVTDHLTKELNMDKKSHLTVLSFGGGQDSTAILLKCIYEPDFKRMYAPEDLIVVMSDTGNEHEYTYDHIKKMKNLCKLHDIPFYFLTNDLGYHTRSWPDLITPQTREEGADLKATMVQLGTKSCTDNLKIVPIYKFLDEYINHKMNYGFNIHKNRGCLKKAIKRFYKEHGSIRVLIGFSEGEESRAFKSSKLQRKQSMTEGDIWEKALNREYPLITCQIDRGKCQELITEYIGYCPMPSNCMLCPYQSNQEILWLYRNHPEQFDLWIEIEQRKIKRYEGKVDKNHGVYNSNKTLSDKLKLAIDKYGHLTDEELAEYKMSHGCSSNAM
jgi:hypothetical protein